MRYMMFTLCGSQINDGLCMCCKSVRECSEFARTVCDECLFKCDCEQKIKIRAREHGWCLRRDDKRGNRVPDDIVAAQLKTMSDNSE